MSEPTFEEQVQLSSLDNIKTEGISIRVGNQIVNFVAAETQDILVEDEVKNEMREGFDTEVKRLSEQYKGLVGSLKDQYKSRNRDLDKRETDLRELMRQNVQLPVLTEKIMRKGLTVSRRDRDDGYVWSLTCVYAPKYVSNKIIDPAFAKRLMTPIRIFIYTDNNWKITEVKLVKLINCEKFSHYHSLSGNRDCWGEMKFQGEHVETPEKALRFLQQVQMVLETINRLSIGTSSPRGLSRLSTVEKHLLDKRPDPENDKRTGASRRNERAGFDDSVNDEATAELWDANSQ